MQKVFLRALGDFEFDNCSDVTANLFDAVIFARDILII